MDISKEDKDLWLLVNKETKPLKKQNKVIHQSKIKAKLSIKQQYILPVERFNANQTKKDQKQGKFKFQSSIDLHGYSLQNAYEYFIEFIEKSYQLNKQNLLVITGHGDNFKSIKNEFCIWIEQPHIKKYIISVKEAHPKQGGSGAYYIILRSNKIV